MQPNERLICALDVDNAYRAIQLVTALRCTVHVFKVGLELVNVAGIQIFDKLKDAGAERIFYDAKLHDIPNTVSGAMRGIVRVGAEFVTLHASGGSAMLRAAVETANSSSATGAPRPRLLAVTLLTSIKPETLQTELRIDVPVAEYVTHLALMAHEAGCDGVVASPHEIEAIRRVIPDPDFLVVTPGVRPSGAAVGDQARVLTPAEAIQRGASMLVVGRPIVGDPDPIAAAERIVQEIAHA